MAEANSITLSFQGAAASLGDIQAELSDLLRQLSDPSSEIAMEASAAGFDNAEFVGAEATVEQPEKGFAEIALLITIVAPAATHVLNKVWDDIIWPRLKSRLGEDAIGEEHDPDE